MSGPSSAQHDPSVLSDADRGRPMRSTVERRTQEIGRQLLTATRDHRPHLMSRRAWSTKLMDWAMRDREFKVQMFRYVDTFPTLRSPQQIHDVLNDYLSQPGVQVPPGLGLGLKAGSVLKTALAKTIAANIKRLAENFIAGHDAQSALPKLKRLWQQQVGFSIDLLGEACLSDKEAEIYQQRYLRLLEHLPREVARWPANRRLEFDHLGPIPRCNVSLKITSLTAHVRLADFQGSLDRLYEALAPILEAAAQQRVTVNFDMEQAIYKDLTIALFRRCCESIDFPASLALQAYLRSGPSDAEQLIQWARGTGRQVTVRLIKGAYWDYEVIHAEQMGWPTPVWTRKQDTDACFERMTQQLVEAIPRSASEGGIHLALGSHNVRSIAHAQALLEAHELPSEAIEYQLLEGMSDELRTALVEANQRVRSYMPLGDMIPGMAYLVRRLLENTSNESWLRGSLSEQSSDDQLLAAPSFSSDDGSQRTLPKWAATHHRLSASVAEIDGDQPFFTEPLRDFSDRQQRELFQAAVEDAVVPRIAQCVTTEEADEAVGRAAAARDSWSQRDVLDRAASLLGTADWFRQRRDTLAGIIIGEAGKTWREADADVCEAIDFCEYYAREAVSLFRDQRLGAFLGELNQQRYHAAGVAVVISPWNFPLAICTGMTVSALVTGNPTLVKPSGQTCGIASLMCEALWHSGVPREVLQFVPGPGSTVGAYLVKDPRVSVIGFTGSREVGFEILKAAGHLTVDQPGAKKVVCEMGGKNAVIVDSTADLDEAVLGVRDSAFGYAGQKCSACSRVIVLKDAYPSFVERLCEATASLTVGDPRDPGTDVGPVIDDSAAQRIWQYIEEAKSESQLQLAVAASQASVDGKPLIGPHIFTEVLPEHTLAREEVFGPVLAVMAADSFEHALQLANDSPFKLTGGVFSRTPTHLQLARRRFLVGNLYLNRGCTGALVGRQPFGGFGHSGTGTKAGGQDYLKHFVNPIVCCENTMRRGFAPGLD